MDLSGKVAQLRSEYGRLLNWQQALALGKVATGDVFMEVFICFYGVGT